MHDEANNFILISFPRHMNTLIMTAYLLSEWFSMGLIGVVYRVCWDFSGPLFLRNVEQPK